MDKSQLNPIKVYVVGSGKNYANWVSTHLVDKIDEANLVLLTGGEDVNPKYYNEPAHPRTYFSQRDIHEMAIIQEAIKKKIPLYGTCRGLQILTVASGGKLIQDQSNSLSEHLLLYKNLILRNDIKSYDLDEFLKSEEVISKIENSLKIRFGINELFELKSTFAANKPTFKKSLNNLSIITIFSKYALHLNTFPLLVTSAHHQAAYPYDTLSKDDYAILSWTEGMHRTHQNGYAKELEIPEDVEIEAILLPKIQAYGIQGHPEWMLSRYKTINKNFNSAFNKYVEESIKIVTDFTQENLDQIPTITDLRNLRENSKLGNYNEVLLKKLTEMVIYLNSYLHFLSGFKALNSSFNVFSSEELLKEIENTIKNYLKYLILIEFSSKFTTFFTLSDKNGAGKIKLFTEFLKIIDEYELSEKSIQELNYYTKDLIEENVSKNILTKFNNYVKDSSVEFKSSNMSTTDFYNAVTKFNINNHFNIVNDVVEAIPEDLMEVEIGVPQENIPIPQVDPGFQFGPVNDPNF